MLRTNTKLALLYNYLRGIAHKCYRCVKRYITDKYVSHFGDSYLQSENHCAVKQEPRRYNPIDTVKTYTRAKTYTIVASSSKGNCVIIDGMIMIDLGVPFSRIEQFAKHVRLVCLTHIHGDHFNPITVKTFAAKYPEVRWGVPEWLESYVIQCGVPRDKIDIMQPDMVYDYDCAKVVPFHLIHEVPNVGYRVFIDKCKVLYATDTSTLSHVEAFDYDLYLVEANWVGKAVSGHLGKKECDAWLSRNMGKKSKFVYMHTGKATQALE